MTSCLYPQTIEGAKRMMEYAGDCFGFPEIAHSTIIESEHPLFDTWARFMLLLGDLGLVNTAFVNAWPENGVVPFISAMNISTQAAEDISQVTAISAYTNMQRYKPWMSKWSTWIFIIAKRLAFDYVKSYHYRNVDHVGIDVNLIEDVETCVDNREIYLWSTINEWMHGSRDQVIFAGLVELAALHGVRLTGQYAINTTGMNKSKLFRLKQKFFRDVVSRYENDQID